ncbi:hypothetical protein [Caloranaerobacter ferrireducens]|uniref:hypothetical protein n=1 Tax=Caloranaerobacter ferrireducens TaxID=1323370 RepID=UPI00084D4BCD|nr:hypothetical protein [Caloranaerobacter ferrireducens]
MSKFSRYLVIFILVIISPFVIFIYNRRIETIETEKMDVIIQRIRENSFVCQRIITLYEKTPSKTFNDLDFVLKEKILNLYYQKFSKNQIFIMSQIEEMLKNNQKNEYMILHDLGDKSYDIAYLYNIPKADGSYYYFKAQKNLLDHVLYVYDKSNYKERKKLLLQFYRYYLPFNSGYQRALADVFND